MEEKKEINSMIRLREMGKLGDDVNAILASIAKFQDVYVKCGPHGKRWRNRYVKRVSQVGLKGLSVLGKKIPIYVEMPKLEETASGCREEITSSGEEVHHVSELPQEVKDKMAEIKAEVLGQISYSKNDTEDLKEADIIE